MKDKQKAIKSSVKQNTEIKKDVPEIEQIINDNALEMHLESSYEFYYNEVTGIIFWKQKNDKNFEELSDYDINSIIRNCKQAKVPCNKFELMQLLQSNFIAKYNPFKMFIERLPKWDGKTDYIQQLADTVKTHNQPLWEKCFEKWMIGMVAGITEKDAVNHTAPILCGGQGIGKTRWISGLVPKQLYNYYFSGTINMKNKDSITQLSECFLIDMDELENLNKKSIGDLKSMMSRGKIKIRRPYGRIQENLKRRASFIGSINDKEFLKDDTGSRRFLCFELQEINNEHCINIDNVFSQALALFNSGFQFWFNKSEEAEIQMSNEQFYKTSLEMEYLMRHFEPADDASATHHLSATEIANILKDRERVTVNDTTVQRIGKALNAKKFVRLKKNNRYVWAVFDKWNNSVSNSKAA